MDQLIQATRSLLFTLLCYKATGSDFSKQKCRLLSQNLSFFPYVTYMKTLDLSRFWTSVCFEKSGPGPIFITWSLWLFKYFTFYPMTFKVDESKLRLD